MATATDLRKATQKDEAKDMQKDEARDTAETKTTQAAFGRFFYCNNFTATATKYCQAKGYCYIWRSYKAD
jgi:hypothetical protein